MAGYIRQDVANNIAAGNVIDASDLDGEFDALVAAFDASTGHTHDGTTAEGAPITVVGPVQDFVGGASDFSPKTDSAYDLGKTGARWATAYIDDLTLTNALPVAQGGTASTTASGARTALGLAIGTDVQAYDAGLADIAGLAVTDGNVIVGNGTNWVAESGATARTSLGLAIGTDVQAYDAFLNDIAGLTDPGADRVLFWDDSAGAMTFLTMGTNLSITGTTLNAAGAAGGDSWGDAVDADIIPDTDSTRDLGNTGTRFAEAYIDSLTLTNALPVAQGGTGSTTASGARTNLGLGSLATLSTINNSNWSGTDLSVANGGTGSSTASGARTALGLAIGTNVQAYDAGLNSIAGLTTAADRMIYTTASDTYAVATLTSFGRSLIDDANAAAARTTLGIIAPTQTVLTSGTAATYTVPANATALKVIAIGGGGGGGGAQGTTSQSASAAGGGAGGYCEIFLTSLEASYTYTIGAAGSAGSSAAGAGGAGGNTTFSGGVVSLSAGGGSGGSGSSASTAAAVRDGAAGGSSSGGDLNITGVPSDGAGSYESSVGSMSNGASSPLGSGGRALLNNTAAAAAGYGSGGGGAATSDNATDRAGGAGSGGIIIVEEFYG